MLVENIRVPLDNIRSNSWFQVCAAVTPIVEGSFFPALASSQPPSFPPLALPSSITSIRTRFASQEAKKYSLC